jgi:hypothetical protein
MSQKLQQDPVAYGLLLETEVAATPGARLHIFLLQRHQRGVASRRGGIDAEGALRSKAVEIIRPARFGSGARQALSTDSRLAVPSCPSAKRR